MESAVNHWQASSAGKVLALQAAEEKVRRAYFEALERLSEVVDDGVAADLGYANVAALLMHTLRISRKEANHRLAHVAELFSHTTPTGSTIEAPLPQTSVALAAGDIGPESVDVIRRTLKDLPDLEPEKRVLAETVMLEQAAEDDPNALARFGARVRNIVDPDGPPPPDPEPQRPARHFRYRNLRDGGIEFTARVDAENAGPLHVMINKCERPRPGDTEDARTFGERLGDGFVEEILKRAANCPDMAMQNGLRTEVAFTIAFEDLKKGLDERILVGNDTYLAAREARRIACDCHLFPAVLGTDSKPLDVAVPTRVVPAHMRRGLVLRDKGCAFPSCEKPASVCDAHHIKHWADLGPTEIDNLVLLCAHHHRLIHRSEWDVRMVNNHPVFIPPTYIDPTRTPRTNALRRPPPSRQQQPSIPTSRPIAA